MNALIKEAQAAIAGFKYPDMPEQYDAMLDELSPGMPAGLPRGYARALQQLDPTTYRCGYADYLDTLDRAELCPEYAALEAAIEDAKTAIETLQDALYDYRKAQP